MSELRHVAHRTDTDARLLAWADTTNLLVLAVTAVFAFVLTGHLIGNVGLKLLVIVGALVLANGLTNAVKKRLAPYPGVVWHGAVFLFSPDELHPLADPDPRPLPPVPEEVQCAPSRP